jgi:hypothetical protein|tara:strand:- start:1060 stop:1272 length:213 start_codon:yes stop_codon:yes gene_type:complete
MEQLIEALQILLKYGNPDNPTHCEHDVLYICGIDPIDVSEEDIETLDGMGFFISNAYGDECFMSFKYGSV